MLEYGKGYYLTNKKILAEFKAKCEEADCIEVYFLAEFMAEELMSEEE